jgi:hypothetical protein
MSPPVVDKKAASGLDLRRRNVSYKHGTYRTRPRLCPHSRTLPA